MSKEFSKSFYRSKEWQKVRAYCLMRDKYLCQRCGKPAEEVHHIKPLTPENIMDVRVSLNPANLTSLCRECHFLAHKWDQAEGRARKHGTDALPEIVFDENGNAVLSPRSQDHNLLQGDR